MSLQFFAPAGVKSARDKKERDDGDEDEVSHRLFQFAALGVADVSSALAVAMQRAGESRRSRFVFTGPICGISGQVIKALRGSLNVQWSKLLDVMSHQTQPANG